MGCGCGGKSKLAVKNTQFARKYVVATTGVIAGGAPEGGPATRITIPLPPQSDCDAYSVKIHNWPALGINPDQVYLFYAVNPLKFAQADLMAAQGEFLAPGQSTILTVAGDNRELIIDAFGLIDMDPDDEGECTFTVAVKCCSTSEKVPGPECPEGK